jgi:hypothetical protein
MRSSHETNRVLQLNPKLYRGFLIYTQLEYFVLRDNLFATTFKQYNQLEL